MYGGCHLGRCFSLFITVFNNQPSSVFRFQFFSSSAWCLLIVP